MTVRDVYKEAIIHKHNSLKMLIDFLIFNKKVLTFEDDESELKRYYSVKNRGRMNQLLQEYQEEMKCQQT